MGLEAADSRDEWPKPAGCSCRLLAVATVIACLAALIGPRIASQWRYDAEMRLLTEAAERRGGTMRVPPGSVFWAGTASYFADFNHRDIDDDFLADFCWMPGFRSVGSLSLSDTPITDVGIAVLRRHPHLVRVITDRTAITDRSIETLLTIPKLQSLHLSGTKVTDAGLEFLKKPRQGLPLLGATVTDTAVTEEAVRKLFKATKLNIIYGSSKAPKTTRW